MLLPLERTSMALLTSAHTEEAATLPAGLRKAATVRRAALSRVRGQDTAVLIQNESGASLAVIEGRAVSPHIHPRPAFAKHGDAALFHQLPELEHLQAQPGRNQCSLHFDEDLGAATVFHGVHDEESVAIDGEPDVL